MTERLVGRTKPGARVERALVQVSGGSGAAPAGTGYTHVTGGVWDPPSLPTPLTTGDVPSPELVFALGDVIMVEMP